VLRLIRSVTEAARPYARPVAVCGEAAADPLAAALLVGLGVDELSVAPGSIGRLRASLVNLDVAACRVAAAQATAATNVADVREIAAGLLPAALAPAGSPAA
jgi:phosphoenolpyruvate-protein kinase (PTS system EI component)